MRRIGFKNFRKFENFPPLDISPITIFVGENNAGKSTVVKGILAFSDFINSRNNAEIDVMYDDVRYGTRAEVIEKSKQVLKKIRFYFDTSYLAHIGTFKRALYNKANEPIISFYVDFGDSIVSVDVKGNPKDEESVSGIVSKIKINNEVFKISMEFNLLEDKATITFNPGKNDNTTLQERDSLANRIKNYLGSFSHPITISAPISQNWYYYRGDLINTLVGSLEESLDASITVEKDISDKESDNNEINNSRHPIPIQGLGREEKLFLKHFRDNVMPIGMPPRHFGMHLSLPLLRGFRSPAYKLMDIEYLYAHAVTQTVIYSAKDTNDYLSRTIHEFASEKYSQARHEFIIKWMKEFHVGVNYAIRSVGGEAHLVYIENSDGERVNLADKGMGSIQLMVLLFRLAIFIPPHEKRSIRTHRVSNYGKIIIIEEPEQNLHPMLQSKLADLFYELYTKFGFRFIIETHSEYLVRRSQVIVGNNKYTSQEELNEHNPFKVYYFPSDGVPYDMVYTPTGMFENKFGEGFINEAGKLHMELLKNAQKKDKDV